MFASLLSFAAAQDDRAGAAPGFDAAAASFQQQLAERVAELTSLRARIAEEKLPLSRRLRELEDELGRARLDHQQTTRKLDERTLELANLRSDVAARRAEAGYLQNLLGEYARNFESRLHVAELERHEPILAAARREAANEGSSTDESFRAHEALLDASLARIADSLGGMRFDGTAVDATGTVAQGTFVKLGPSVLFRAADGSVTGTAEQRLGSLAPAVITFGDAASTAAVTALVAGHGDRFVLDPTLGNARKVEATQETFVEHLEKGGPVMVPILVLAAAALVVVLVKWLSMAFLRTPSRRRIRALLDRIAAGDRAAAIAEAKTLPGPVGRMLLEGTQHLGEPRELVEEVMYEQVLATRLSLQRFLPFVAISASSAPLLGLLGTVTGIMNTFTLMTQFGTGDPATLSSGISEALITTEYGLIVAIPSLLLHAFLSRKSRSITDAMDRAAVALLNQMSVAGRARAESAA